MIYVYKISDTEFFITKKKLNYEIIFKCDGKPEYLNTKKVRKSGAKKERKRVERNKQEIKEYRKNYYKNKYKNI